MRTLLFLALCLIITCVQAIAEGKRTKPAAPSDKNPVIAALTHFRGIPNLPLFPLPSPRRHILLVDSNRIADKGAISSTRLSIDLCEEDWSVPEDARLDIERRTDANESHSTSDFPSFVRFLDFRERNLAGHPWNFAQHHHDARCWIKLLPAGFTHDGNRAVVWFRFGPTPAHESASAIYLLDHRDDLWYVIRYKVTFHE